MIKKIVLLLLFLFCSVCLKTTYAEENKQELNDFNSRMRQASQMGVQGHTDQAKVIFEEMLKANPGEWLIYDVYAQALTIHGDYDGAIKIYERALTQGQGFGTARKEEIRDLIAKV